MLTSRWRLGHPSLAGLFCLLAGCSASPYHPETVFVVRGKLTYQGGPMDYAQIAFIPINTLGQASMTAAATTDQKGEYQLSTYVKGDGAPPGDYLVTIYWPDRSARKESPSDDEEELPDKLQQVYASPSGSPLRATVARRKNEISFNLP